MTKNEFIIQSVLSMNKCGDIEPNRRVDNSIQQLMQLVSAGVYFDEEIEEEEKPKFEDPYINSIVGGK